MLGLAGSLMIATPPGAFSAEHILRPYTDRIALCEAAGHELARQAALRQAELEAHLIEEVDAQIVALETEHQRG